MFLFFLLISATDIKKSRSKVKSPKKHERVFGFRDAHLNFEITQVDIDCQYYFSRFYSRNKIMENISMIPYKKQLDISIQKSIYENIYITTLSYSAPKISNTRFG